MPFPSFSPRHIPTLLIASATTFGGLWPLWDARGAMLEFGFPKRIAESAAAAPVMICCSARTSTLGLLVFLFYAQGKLRTVDIILAVMGLYIGVLDGYVCWTEGVAGEGVKRAVASFVVAAWGLGGMTNGRAKLV